MVITIDTVKDTLEDAIAAVYAAFGATPGKTAPTLVVDDADEVDEGAGADDYLPGNWTRKRIRKLAKWVVQVDAGEALRYMAENAPAVDIDEVIKHMGEYLGVEGFTGQHMGGRMSSVGFAMNSIKGTVANIYDTDYKNRKYRMDKSVAKVLLEELAAAAA